MPRLQFQTKGRNLRNLQGVLKNARILPLVLTSLEQLRSNEEEVYEKILALKAPTLIIRSSSCSEDSMLKSNAGAFLSLANIPSNAKHACLEALYEVGNSMPKQGDEILIQPYLENIELCGVGFSVDKDSCAPYFCLQYDLSGSNDSITSGSAKNVRSYYHYRYNLSFKDERMRQIIELIKELEELYAYEFLDIEFAFAQCKQKTELFCLQVRPLIVSQKQIKPLPKSALERFHKRFLSLEHPRPRILGKRALFGVMPDWNPAEMIGLRPKRLAFSLYKELITDTIWAYQRDNYGYRDLRSHPLMHSFLGMPYIDVRLSFNSFIPKNLDEGIALKLVDSYVEKLAKNHQLHDKIEFDIVYSCYDFNITHKLKELLNYNFNENEIKRLEFCLLELTNNIIDPKAGLYLKDIAKAFELRSRYEHIVNSNLSLIDKIYWLIEECKRYGTLPFAGVARAAFVAMNLLNSLVAISFFSKEEKMNFLNSLNTISKILSEKIQGLNLANKEDFLKEFGHLRAGSYNILSPRYDENFELYFDMKKTNSSLKKKGKNFKLSQERIKQLDILLKEHGLRINSHHFLKFLKEAIEGRELLKFEFTRLLSQVLVYLRQLGEYYGIDALDLAHLDIKNVLNLYSSLYSKNPREQFLEEINRNKKEYELSKVVKLPPLLYHAEQIFSFHNTSIIPNFITQKSVLAPVALENDKDIEGKIVLICAADPGYDYLFAKNIAGFITCYGGANSHMAIRACELDLPAVIGVGEENFKKYLKASKIKIECQSEQIFCL